MQCLPDKILPYHLSYKDLKETGWKKRDCGHWAPEEWRVAWALDEGGPLLSNILAKLQSVNWPPQESRNLYLRMMIRKGDYDEKFKSFIDDCRDALKNKNSRDSIPEIHRNALSTFVVASSETTHYPYSYRADLFITPKAFKWFPKLVWAHMRLFNDQVGSIINKAVNNKKPSRPSDEKYKIRFEFEMLKKQVKLAIGIYRKALNKTGIIDTALMQTRNNLTKSRSPLSGKKYWVYFEPLAKESGSKRLAYAEIAADIMAKYYKKPKLKSSLLSNKF